MLEYTEKFNNNNLNADNGISGSGSAIRGVEFFPYVTVGVSAGTDGAREVCVCCKCCINVFCSFLHLLT